MSYELRPYQEEAMKAVLNEWKTGHKKTIVIMATGCGKTILFSKIIEERLKDKNARVLILAHREELLSQATDKLYKSTGITSGIEKAQKSSLKNGDNERVIVGSIQSMAGKRLEQITNDYFTDIIIDEAHHCISGTYQRVLKHFDNANVLGVTATPNRADKKSIAEYFDSVAYEYSMIDAIKDGYLCDIAVQRIPLKLDISKVNINAGDYAPGELAGAIDPYLEQIATQMEKYCKNKKTIVFTPLIKTSQKFRDILNEHGFNAAEVNGTSPDRTQILNDFEIGKINVLVNALVLTEGYDCPSVDCIVMLRPTQSISLFTQAVGRGTRLCEGKDKLLLLDFLWLTGKHDLCRPPHLIASDDEIARRMCCMIDDSDIAMDLRNLESCAQESLARDLEESLKKKLEFQRKMKSDFISSLQFFASMGELNQLREEPAFKWEEEKATKSQLDALEKMGIDISQVKTKGLAHKILALCFKRRAKGLSTIKQIKFLERYGFVHVGKWTFEEASSMIDRIAKNKWRIPREIVPKMYKPMYTVVTITKEGVSVG